MSTMKAVCSVCLYAREVTEFKVGRLCSDCVVITIFNLTDKKESLRMEVDTIVEQIDELKTSKSFHSKINIGNYNKGR